jgi:hypothetical protein
MKLSIKERMELRKFLKIYHSDSIDEMILANNIFNGVGFTKEEKELLALVETPQGYSIGLEQDNDLPFSDNAKAFLTKVNTLLETNCMVTIDNVSLCVKIREME